MKRLKIILEENGSGREISYIPKDVLNFLDHDSKYNFSLGTEKRGIFVNYNDVSPFEIATLIPGITGRLAFTEKHCAPDDKRLDEIYLIKITKAA